MSKPVVGISPARALGAAQDLGWNTPDGVEPLFKVTIRDNPRLRFGAYFWTAAELRALRDALCMVVPDDVSEPEEIPET